MCLLKVTVTKLEVLYHYPSLPPVGMMQYDNNTYLPSKMLPYLSLFIL